jgi:hypothetical protein
MTPGIPCCEQMRYALDEPSVPLVWTPKFREIGIWVLDGGDSNIVIVFCPWCGNKLPESLRNAWFDELERRNIDPAEDEIPPQFLDERWYTTPAK